MDTWLQGNQSRDKSHPARCPLSRTQSVWNGKHTSYVLIRGHPGLEQPFFRHVYSDESSSVQKGKRSKSEKWWKTSGPCQHLRAASSGFAVSGMSNFQEASSLLLRILLCLPIVFFFVFMITAFTTTCALTANCLVRELLMGMVVSFPCLVHCLGTLEDYDNFLFLAKDSSTA